RDVEVLVAQDRELRQQRIAVMAVRIHGVAAVGELRPHAVGEEFVLWRFGPVVDPRRVALVGPQYFLEEQQVGADGAYRIAQLGQDETPVEEGEALVGIHRQYTDAV